MRKQLIGALGAASLAVCGAALAAPTLVGTKTNASGIDGVVVDSVTYESHSARRRLTLLLVRRVRLKLLPMLSLMI
jgi:hypothetical protein